MHFSSPSLQSSSSVQKENVAPSPSTDNTEQNDQAVIEALQYYFRQSALTQRNHLPRWASW